MPDMKTLLVAVAALTGGLGATSSTLAECMLANPSFEVPGSAGATFGGWNQFGSTGISTLRVHGAKGARVSGPNTHAWDVSGYWQNLTTTPGESWSVSAWVAPSSTRPLTGLSKAIVNVEWRDSGGGLISYESHTAADASTPTDQFQLVSFQTGPAPAGTASTHLLLGVLQSPTDPVPDVFYDQVTFNNLTPPTLQDKQWLDFPGGRTISFGGRSWRVKGPGYYGPGPSLFSNATSAVWVDASDRLHLTIQKISGSWYSSEVTLEQPSGYGDYIFTTRGRLDTLDPKTVFGMFIWEYGPCYDPANGWWNPYNEVDVEFSRWGIPGNAVAQFVAQPYDAPGNLNRFDMSFADGEVTSHAFRWLPDRVQYRTWRGGPNDESPATLVHQWTYAATHLPRPESPRVHINMWQFNGAPATYQEVVLDAFTFVPACASPPCLVLAVKPPEAVANRLANPVPNPFRSVTEIRFASQRSGPAEIAVYDLLGRRVRTLLGGSVPAGDHVVAWDGRDDAGRPVPAGVYLCRIRAGDAAGMKRMVLVK